MHFGACESLHIHRPISKCTCLHNTLVPGWCTHTYTYNLVPLRVHTCTSWKHECKTQPKKYMYDNTCIHQPGTAVLCIASDFSWIAHVVHVSLWWVGCWLLTCLYIHVSSGLHCCTSFESFHLHYRCHRTKTWFNHRMVGRGFWSLNPTIVIERKYD